MRSTKDLEDFKKRSTLLQVYKGLPAWTQLNDMSYTMGSSIYTKTVCYTLNWFIPPPPPPPYPFDCVILQVIVSLRASLKQLIISVVITTHKNSPILNWPQIVTSNDLLKCCCNLATLFQTQAIKSHSSFLNHLLLWWQHRELLLLFGKFKACIKTYVDFRL